MRTSIASQLNTLKGSLCIADRSGTVVFANTSILDRTGFSVAEAVGKRPGQIWGGNMSASFYSYMWKTIAKEKRPFVGSLANQTKQGKTYQDSVQIAPIVDVSGDVAYYIEVHPMGSVTDKAKFREDFLSCFSQNRVGSMQVLQLIEKWCAPSDSFQKDSMEFHDAIDIIEKECVPFIQAQFADRYDDKILLERAQHDQSAFGDIYCKYYSFIEQYMRIRVGDNARAQELAQDVFIKALSHISTFEYKNASYKTYLLRIAHNMLVNFYRDTQSVDTIEDHFSSIASSRDTNQVIYRLLWQQALNSLNQLEQQIMTLKYIEGMKVRDIAEVVEKTENAVKLLLSRTRKKMKDVLK